MRAQTCASAASRPCQVPTRLQSRRRLHTRHRDEVGALHRQGVRLPPRSMRNATTWVGGWLAGRLVGVRMVFVREGGRPHTDITTLVLVVHRPAINARRRACTKLRMQSSGRRGALTMSRTTLAARAPWLTEQVHIPPPPHTHTPTHTSDASLFDGLLRSLCPSPIPLYFGSVYTTYSRSR
jgi:hypothetical protein